MDSQLKTTTKNEIKMSYVEEKVKYTKIDREISIKDINGPTSINMEKSGSINQKLRAID